MMDFKKKYIDKQRDISEIGISPKFPRIVKIDVCNTCNYNCIFCPQAKQIKKIGKIDDELCYRIIRTSYEAGARELCLSMTGEPLLNTELENYISYAKKIGYEYIFINTNGYLCDEKRAQKLLESGLDSIKFSVNADKKSYALVHGVDGFDTVVANIKRFYELREENHSKCKIYISYVAVIPTLQESERLCDRMKDFCDEIIIVNANNRAGSISELDKGLFAGSDEYAFKYPCSQLFNNVYVTAEGYMVICCQDFENLTVVADLNNESIEEAWNGDAFTSFRKKYLQKDLEGTLCYNCINNCDAVVKPLNEKYAGYKESEAKKKNLDKRILEILTQ